MQTPKRGHGTFPEAGEGDWARLVPRSKGREEVASRVCAQGDGQSAKTENRPHQFAQMVCAPHVPGTGAPGEGRAHVRMLCNAGAGREVEVPGPTRAKMIIARGLIKVYIFRLRCVRAKLVCHCPQQPPALRSARVKKLIRPRHIRQPRLGHTRPLRPNEPGCHYRARVSVGFQPSPRARSIRSTEGLAHDLAEATLPRPAKTSSALCPNELLASLQELRWRSKTLASSASAVRAYGMAEFGPG